MKYRVPTLLLFMTIVAGAGACQSGGGSNLDVTTSTKSFTYKLEDSGCKTGEHSFTSKSDYCNGLKDDSLNGGCASSGRQDLYNLNCTGNSSGDTIMVNGEISGTSKVGLTYSYRFDQSECSTGEHTFSNLVEFCTALADENLNSQCAPSERKTLASANCVGSATAPSRYSYRFDEGECTTGEHFFDSKESFCAAFGDNDLNNNCAQDIRDEVFKTACSGSDSASAELPSPSSCTLKVMGPDGVTTIQAESAEGLVSSFQQAKNAVSFCRSL